MKKPFRLVSISTIGAFLFSFLSPFAALAAPSIGSVSPSSNLTAGAPTALSVSVNSSVAIQSCNLYIDSADVGAMTVSGNTASKSYTFPFARVYTAFVFCRDINNGIASGPNTSINVTQGQSSPSSPPLSGGEEEPGEPVETPQAPEEPEAPMSVAVGSLVTLPCPEGADVNDSCKAVYYVGADGKRHAFPNAKTYFTWYDDFDDVQTVTAEELSELPLGANVTYRPGVRMVKFRTLNDVYAVGIGGVLRWISTEEIAVSLYGEDWNTKIDDISDSFFTNYDFGEPIESGDAYDAMAETAEAEMIDDSL